MVRKNLGPRPAFAGFALIQLVGPGEKKRVNIIKKKENRFQCNDYHIPQDIPQVFSGALSICNPADNDHSRHLAKISSDSSRHQRKSVKNPTRKV